MTAKDNILKFIQTDQFDDGGLLQSAFDKAKSSGLAVEMVSGSELMKSDLEKDKAVFVTVVFTGEYFESLVAKQKRIFGPLCILRCLEKSIPLPNVYHPVYSLAMNGVVMSCTSIDTSLRNKLYQLVKSMGGISAKDFTSSVTHLVAGEVGSKKYTVACNKNALVVLPSWVEEAWNATQQVDFDATDSDFVASHLCPIFKGCSFCVTGIEGSKRKEIKSAVENHGGVYSAELKLKSTTHLLVERPTGDKYEFAMRWNVNCVRPDWLYDCIEAGHWLDEASYLVKSERDLDQTRSTGGRLSITTVNTTTNSTIGGTGVSKKAAEAARQSAKRYEYKDTSHESKLSTDAGVKRMVVGHKNEDDFDFNVTIPSGSMFLDGCKIYLTGFTGEKLECLQKIINAGGGTRFNQINASVSHVVMGAKVTKDIEILSKAEFIPHVVTAKWLLDSCCQETCLPETDYHCMETNDVFENVSSKKDRKQMTSGQENVVENDDVFNQYLEFVEDDDITGLEEPNTGLETDKNMAEPIKKAKECLKLEDDDDSVDDDDDDEKLQGLLYGLIIGTEGFSAHEETEMKDIIESNAGSVLDKTSTKIADFIIVPMNYECDSSAKTKVTFCWLERSLECGELLDPTSNFLFAPFSLAENVFPLKDSVISISQYSGMERDHLMQLAEMLGAHYQEYFSRIARNNLSANTQLLLQEPTGPKYDAAVHWNVPAVSAEWLFECARTGTKVPEGPYKLDEEQPPKEKEMVKEKGMKENEKGKKEVRLENAKVSTFPSSSHTIICDPERSSNNEEMGRMKTKDVLVMPKENETGKELSKSIPVSTDSHPVIIKPPPYFGRPKRPSFDLSDAIESLQSPVCSSGSSSAHSRLSRSSRSSFLLDDYIQENMQAALKNSSNPLRSHDNGMEITSTITKDEQPEENKELETNKFLHGVVLVVSKKLNKQQTDIHNMASAVGADCRCSLDDSCTHVIHEGRLTREYNQVKSKGVYVISPHWLYTCVDEQRHVDESLFPSTYNPKLTLPVVKTRRSVQVSKEVKHGAKHEARSKETDSKKLKETDVEHATSLTTETSSREMTKNAVTGSVLDTEGKELSQDSGQSDSLRSKEEIRQIHGIMQAMSTHRRSKRLHSNNSDPNSRNSLGNSVGESSRKNSRRQSSRLRSLRSKQNSSEDEADEQPVETITYDDPKSRIERERIIAQLSNCSPNPPTNSECSGDGDDTIDENQDRRSKSNHSTTEDEMRPLSAVKTESPSPSHSPVPAAPPIALQITTAHHELEPISLLNPVIELENVKPQKAPKFLLSAMSQQEKIDYGALIEDLGGQVFDNQYFSPECCHIIVGQLTRNEKCLASIAAGNWVLHKSFLEASRKAGHFVDEEDHEWGVKIPGESLSNLAIAARRWRMEKTSQQKNSNTKFGAFHNWKVLLCIESSRLASFTRMLQAGGAEVLGTTSRLNDTNSATHAFISLSKSSPIESVDVERLNQAGVLVLRVDYISDYLIESSPPSTHKYVYRKPQERLKSRKRKPDEDFSEKNGEKRSRKS